MSTYIAPVEDAGVRIMTDRDRMALILQNEMNWYEEEWKKVTDKIRAFRGLLNDVGTLCVKYGLKREHLPHEFLRNINIKLDGLDHELTQARNDWRVTKVISGDDLTRRIQFCDRECSNLVQNFESALRDARLDSEQVAEGYRALHSGPPQPMYDRSLYSNNMTAMGTSQNQSWILHQSPPPPPWVYAPQQHGYDGSVPGPAQMQLHQSTGRPTNRSETRETAMWYHT